MKHKGEKLVDSENNRKKRMDPAESVPSEAGGGTRGSLIKFSQLVPPFFLLNHTQV